MMAIATVVVATIAPVASAQDLRWSGSVTSAVGAQVWTCDEGPCKLSNPNNRNVLKLGVDSTLGPQVALHADLQVRNLSESKVDGAEDAGDIDNIQPTTLRLGEMWVEAYDLGVEGLDLRVGNQTIHWGTGDGFSPADRVNPYDLEDPLFFDRRLPVPAATLGYGWGDLQLSASWLPFFTPSLLAGDLIETVTDQAADQNISFDDVEGDVPTVRGTRTRTKLPEQTVAESAFALRAEWAARFADLALGYYYGRDSLPQISGEVVPEAFFSGSEVDLLVHVRYPRLQMISAEARAPLGAGITVWTDAVLVLPSRTAAYIAKSRFEDLERLNIIDAAPDHDVQAETQTGDPYVINLAGADVTLGDLVYVNLQYVRGFLFERDDTDLHHYGTLALRLPSGDSPWVLELRGGGEAAPGFDALGWMTQLKVTSYFADYFESSLLVALQDGQDGTTLGAFRRLSEARIQVGASF